MSVLVAAAVCPHPPLLVPEAMGASGRSASRCHQARQHVDAQIRALRSACQGAAAALAAARPDVIAVVGAADRAAVYPDTAAGSLQTLGIPFVTGYGDPVLPLALTVGAWLIRALPAARPATGPPWRLHLQAVQRSLSAGDCLHVGAVLAGQAPRVALLAMGDGPARRAIGMPGAPDRPADDYAAEVAAALADADPARLARLDPARDAELVATGRPAWQVLAGAADGGRLRGRVEFAAAPLGVSYLVAVWER